MIRILFLDKIIAVQKDKQTKTSHSENKEHLTNWKKIVFFNNQW
jgi:hypothetical protein